ncbi:MAG: GGDEF domain-containing protein [Anaerolineaceae bacterium]|nr:GGDEF domain-containing protein [Anaerolineaceae bacterium]
MKQHNNIGKTSAEIILLVIIAAVVLLLGFQYFFLNRLNREHAFQTGEVLADQIEKVLLSNDRKQQVLIETLKENYISKAKAVSFFIDKDPKSEENLDELLKIAELMSIDEIHLFTEEGVIYFGSVPKYYGYSFDSGEQMAYFKPMLSDKSLSMCQDVTPNTAESKSMMYAICWNSDGTRMVQVGIEPVRLIEELHSNEISEVVNDIPVTLGMYLIVADRQSERIAGSTIAELVGKSLSAVGISSKMSDDSAIMSYTTKLNNYSVYCSEGLTDKYMIFVVQSVNEINENIPKMMLIVFLYLLLASFFLIFIVKKLTVRILHEKENADTDVMTGMKNRRAYEDAILRIEKEPISERKDLVCMIIDINELKMINDRYGHDAGDKVIKAFAGIISKIFGRFGNLYRIGGDEFAAFLTIDQTLLPQLIEEADAECRAWSAENKINLTMSCGAVSAEEFPDASAEVLTQIADKRMYDKKTLFYQKSGNDRRQGRKTENNKSSR